MRLTFAILLASFLTAGSASAQWSLIDDFSSSGSAQWTNIDLLGPNGLGPAVLGVQNGRFQARSSTSLPPLPVTATAGAALTASFVTNDYRDGDFEVVVRCDNGHTNIQVMTRLDVLSQSGMSFSLDNFNDVFIIGGIAGGRQTTAQHQFVFLPVAVGVDYHIKGRSIGDRFLGKIWVAGTPEPADWMLEHVEPGFNSSGFGVSIYNTSIPYGGNGGVISGSFDDVSFAPADPTVNFVSSSGASSQVSLVNSGLLSGREYYNLVSLVPCSTLGTGPIFGLCATSLDSLLIQLNLPVNSAPFHFIATDEAPTFGPYQGMSNLTIEAVCLDVTRGSLNAISPVTRFIVP